MVKYLKILVRVCYEQKDNLTLQHFIFKEKNKQYIHPKYIIYTKLKKMIFDSCLPKDFFCFVQMFELQDRITVEYENLGSADSSQLTDIFFTLADFVPSDSCTYCKYGEEKEKTIHCEVKKKYLIKPLKKCRFFMQNEVIFNP